MTKRELLLGSLVVTLLLCCLIFFFLDYINTATRLGMMPARGLESNATPLGWILGISAVTSVIVGALFALGALIAKPREGSADKLTLKLSAKIGDRLGVNAAIPWYYVFLLVPVVVGFVLMLLTMNPTWGWLSCLSIPSVFLFLLLGILRISRQNKSRQSKQ